MKEGMYLSIEKEAETTTTELEMTDGGNQFIFLVNEKGCFIATRASSRMKYLLIRVSTFCFEKCIKCINEKTMQNR